MKKIILSWWGPVILMALLIALFSTVLPAQGGFGTTAYSSLAANSFIVVHQPGGNTTGLLVSQLASSASTQAGIQYKDEGSNLGASNTVTSVNFVGAGVTATRASNEITVTIPVNDGVYTPSITKNTASDTIISISKSLYSAGDSIVSLSGKFLVNSAAGTLVTSVQVSLPPGISSNFTVADDVSGISEAWSDSFPSTLKRCNAVADTTNDKINISWETTEPIRQTIEWNLKFVKK